MEKEPGNSQAIETKQKTGKAKSKDKDNGGGVNTIVTSASCGSISLSASSITNINNTASSGRIAGGDNLSGDVSTKPESSNGKRRKNLNLAHIIKEDNKDKPILVSSVRDLSGIGEGEGFHHSSSRLSSTASPTSLSSSLGNLGVGVVGISPSALITQNHKHNSKKHKNNDESGGVPGVAASCSSSQSQLLLDLQATNSVVAGDKLNSSSASTSKLDSVINSQTDRDKDDEDDNIIILDDEDLIAELTQSQRQNRQPPFTAEDDIIFLNDIEDNSPVKYREIATWTAEDDMPSPLSELSPVESPLKGYHSQTHLNNNSATSSNSNIHNRSQFDQLQLQHQQHLHQQQQHSSGYPIHHHHHHNHRSHHHQKSSGSSSQNHHHRPILSHEYHHHPLPPLPVPQHQVFPPSLGNQQLPECFTVSSQLLTREARLYENVPTSQSGLETLEILLGENHSTNNLNFTSPQNNNTASTSNNSNSNNSAGGKSNNSGVGTAELLSVTDLLGAGGCLVVGGPPSRTSWADSGRESLSFDGENNNSNSNGSSRNLLLIPPPPPPPINYITGGGHHSSHSGFVGSGNNPGGNNIMMQSPSHNSHQGHSHSQAQQSHSKRSRRERLVRQKQAIEETFLPIPGNSEKNGTNPGGNGHHNNGSGYLAVPSPRRAILNGSVIASNFAAAAASPISLQRHPPAQQIMLQENKKNRPLIACESPYGCMTGGPGAGGTNDWNYGGGNGNGNGKSNMLRCKSPQRGRGRPGQNKGQNQSFDYGELPSHQMFPKRHLLTSRQYSQQYNNGNGAANSPFLQPNQQHRSFPAGLFSGATPRSCSMGDLTSSASPGNQGHNHHSKSPEQHQIIASNTNPGALQSSTVPLVTSLPLPPATSVTYEFSLAPVSGTLAPGWHLTAVQRGLATAVPLAAVVARRRLPRPRPTRPRFGFTDKNEARRAKWTIVITALVLLAMSMLLVGVTLRLAPLIDDLGSSSVPSRQYLDPYGRRASGGPISLSRSFENANGHGKSGSYHGYSRSSSRSRCSDKFRTNGAENYINRHISTTLSIPSRQASVQSCSSARSSCSERGKINASLSNPKDFYRFSRQNATSSSMKSLKSLPIAGRASRSESIFSITGGIPLKDLPPKERRHKKVAIAVFIVSSFLLIVAVLCIIVSLLFSRHIDDRVRRENANILQSLQPTPSTINTSSTVSTNNISSKETNSGFGSGGGIRSTSSSLTISNSDTNYDSSNNSNNNNEGPPPISQSLIVEAIVQGRKFYEKVTAAPSSRINKFDLAMDMDTEDDSGSSSL